MSTKKKPGKPKWTKAMTAEAGKRLREMHAEDRGSDAMLQRMKAAMLPGSRIIKGYTCCKQFTGDIDASDMIAFWSKLDENTVTGAFENEGDLVEAILITLPYRHALGERVIEAARQCWFCKPEDRTAAATSAKKVAARKGGGK